MRTAVSQLALNLLLPVPFLGHLISGKTLHVLHTPAAEALLLQSIIICVHVPDLVWTSEGKESYNSTSDLVTCFQA